MLDINKSKGKLKSKTQKRQKKAKRDTEGEEYRLDDLMGGESREDPKGLRGKNQQDVQCALDLSWDLR